MTLTTNQRTFGKATKKMLKDIMPNAKRMKKHGQAMSQFINFYDANNNLIGYWTNENKKPHYKTI